MFERQFRCTPPFALWIAFVVLLAAIAPTALAQSYPTKPIRMIIPFAPGGGNDVVGRRIAAQLSERLGKQVVADNRAGGAGVIGTEIAANSQPDGYTLLVISATYTVTPLLYKLPYDPVKSFVPVTMMAASPNLLAVHRSLPVKSVKELIALAKAKPGELTYATAGAGSNSHLSGALFSSLAHINIVPVAFRGGGSQMISVVAGETQMAIGPMVSMLPHATSGRLKILGIGSTKRSAVLPDVPTIAEAGVPGYESGNWWGIMAPAGTSSDIANKLYTEVSAILSSAESRKWFASQGAEPVNIAPDKFGKLIMAEMHKWQKVIKEFNIRVE